MSFICFADTQLQNLFEYAVEGSFQYIFTALCEIVYNCIVSLVRLKKICIAIRNENNFPGKKIKYNQPFNCIFTSVTGERMRTIFFNYVDILKFPGGHKACTK